jgi:phage-related protein
MTRFRHIILPETENGRCAVADFISTIKWRVDRAKITKVFEAVETMQSVPSLYLKKLTGRHQIWEIRARSYRFLGFYAQPGRLVLVHAFAKKSQKTPPQEIEVAVARRRAYSGQQELPL